MSSGNDSLSLTVAEIVAAFSGDWARKFPPFLTIDQAASLVQVPKKTLYDWRSRGLLDRCSRRVGKRILFVRDRFIHQIFNEGLAPDV